MGDFKEAATCSKDFSPSARCSTKRSETPKRKMFLQSVEKIVFRRKRKTGKATFLQLNHTLFCHLLAIARILMINDAVEEAIKQAIDQQHPKLHPPFIFGHLSDLNSDWKNLPLLRITKETETRYSLAQLQMLLHLLK